MSETTDSRNLSICAKFTKFEYSMCSAQHLSCIVSTCVAGTLFTKDEFGKTLSVVVFRLPVCNTCTQDYKDKFRDMKFVELDKMLKKKRIDYKSMSRGQRIAALEASAV